MNRSRVGLAALVIGVGAAVRRRMKTRIDPGPDVTALAADTGIADETTSSEALSPSKTPDAGIPITDEAPGVSLGDPEIDASDVASVGSSLGDPEIDSAAAPSSLGDPEIDASGGVPLGASLGDPEPDSAAAPSSPDTVAAVPGAQAGSESPNADSVPTIVLPTMPPAGSQTEDTSETAAETMSAVAPGAHTEQALPTTLADSIALSGRSQTNPNAPVEAPPVPLDAAFAAPPAEQPAISAAADTPDETMPVQAAPARPDGPGDRAPTVKQPFHRAHRGWSIAGGILFGLLVTAVIAASVVRLPYYSLEPGSVYDTIERVEAPGELVSIPTGEIGFVTVAQTANITPLQWLDAKLDNNVRIQHEDEVRGDQTADELREADVRRMQVSKDAAVVVALQKLGFELVITPIGIEVAQVFDCTAADGTLGTGDLIVGVNGIEVLSGEQLVEQLMNQAIGDEVDLLIERIDPSNPTQSMSTDLVALTLGSADDACLPDDVRAEEPRPFIGIGTLPMFDEDFPIDIDVRTGNVSGPSAGLAFTLAIIDVLSEGELANGLSVVATGTIDRDGNVGPVGGIHQKTVAAERSGADVFIVPRCCDNFVDRNTGEPLDIPGNYDEAILYAEDMIVIGVDTLDDALIALGELGGDVDRFLTQG